MSLRPLAAGALALCLVLLVAPGQALADYVPAGFAAYTEDLEAEGYVNGSMDYDRLMTSYGCQLERDAAYTFALMMEEAEDDGVYIGTEDCYRSYWTQQAAWESRCPITDVKVRVVNPRTGKTTIGIRQTRVCHGPPTARAGQSNHGWGRAVDFTDGYGVLNCWDPAFLWLQANAFKYGWVHPPWAHCGLSTEEPWHWEWAGVVDENLVPDYSSIWIFNDITRARMASEEASTLPLPAPGMTGDLEFYERWDGLGHGLYHQLPDR